MRLGLNLPWIDCGHDFGRRPPAWGGHRPERNYAKVVEELARTRDELGTDVVRMWVLGGGVNYPAGLDVLSLHEVGHLPAQETLLSAAPSWWRRAVVQASGWDHQRLVLGDRPLLPLDDEFLEDFESLLQLFARHGLKLMPVLVSFEFFHPIERQVGGVVSRGRSSFVFGDSGRDLSQIGRFLDVTLSPLLALSETYRGAIEAWEVMNEPDWSTEGGPVHARLHPRRIELMPKTVRADMMSAFLGEATDRIVDAGFVSSIGFKMAEPKWLTASLRKRLISLGAEGRYLHQVHHYPSIYEPWTLRPHASLAIQPCIVGEMATIQGKPLGVHIAWWRERLTDLRRAGRPDEYLRRRLEIVEELGYPMALLWSAHSKDMATDFGPGVQRQVRDFVGN